MAVRILDLFCGMGGLSLGFALALGDAEIRGLDIDPRAVAAYSLNLSGRGARAEAADILRWEPGGAWDLVMGGSPCQPFSVAVNPRHGKIGESHPLYPTFPRFFDIVLALEPKAFLLENVPGLLRERFRPLLRHQLARVGREYVVRHRILDAARYGVPQRRARLFVLGIRRGLGVAPGFPPPTHAERETATLTGRLRRWVTVREAIGDLLAAPSAPLAPDQAERIRREREDTSRHLAKMGFPDSLDEPSRTVCLHTAEGTKRETIVLPYTGYQRRHPPLEPDRPSRALASHMAKTSRDALVPLPDMVVFAGKDDIREYRGSPAPTLMDLGAGGPRQGRPLVPDLAPATTVQGDPRLWPPGRHDLRRVYYRRLTPRECLRLQSFPDWWAFPEGMPKTAMYRLAGEAVPPILAYRLARHLAALLGWKARPPDPEDWQLPYFERALGGG